MWFVGICHLCHISNALETLHISKKGLAFRLFPYYISWYYISTSPMWSVLSHITWYECKFTSSVGKYNPELKIYFPGIDTPTTNEGFSPSVVVVCQFQGSKFWWRILSNWWRSLFYISKNSFRTTWRAMVFNPLFHRL